MFAKGKDSISRSDITDPGQQMMFDRMAQRMGNTTGQITKQQFVESMQQRMAAGGGLGGGGRGRGAGRGGVAPGGLTVSAPTPSPNAQWGSDPTEGMFRRLDQNGDGFLNTDEMPQDLRTDKNQWDTNKDGLIDLKEFKEYMKSKNQQWQGGAIWVQTETPEVDEKRPVVYHADNLPKDLLLPNGRASWFQALDKDHDAQIGLYEWKDSGRPLEEFLRMDRNADGYLTVEEVLYYLAVQDKATAKLKGGPKNVATALPTPGGPGGFGRPGRAGGAVPAGPRSNPADPSLSLSPRSRPNFQIPNASADSGPRGNDGPRSGGGAGRRRRGAGDGQER
jgi:Ca2+-binding EF-hand superfamily protein